MNGDLADVVPLWGSIRHPRRARRLPPEPPPGSTVRLSMFHPSLGLNPVFDRYPNGGYLPVGWIPPHPYTWAQLYAWNGYRPPTVLLESS